jgi:L-ascorbate 6-phosphate lactonase
MKRFSLFLMLCMVFHSSFSQDKRMIDRINDQPGGTTVYWAGHDSWIIKSEGLVVATDLYLDNGDRIEPAPITPEEIAPILDISFVTHAHDDHFNKFATRVLIEKSKCIFVLPESCLDIARDLHIPENRIVVARPRVPFDIKGIHVNPIRAIHGNANFAIYYDANLQDCGYELTIGGKTFLQPGDSYLLEDHLFLKHVDVLFFSPTEHNMYIDRSVILINTLDPDYIFPQHFGTIKVTDESRFWAKGYPDEVKIRLSQPLQDKYHKLKPGDSWDIR